MSSWAQESNFRRRISERRRLKMLKNLDQYKISNPYRYLRGDPPIPQDLSKQLKKLDYLSSTSISMITLSTLPSDQNSDQVLLFKMAMALQQQENRFKELFGEVLDQREVEFDQYSHSHSLEPQPTHPSHGSQAIQTKDEMPIHIYQYQHEHFNQNLFQSHIAGPEQLRIMQSQDICNKPAIEVQLMNGQDYQQYFMN